MKTFLLNFICVNEKNWEKQLNWIIHNKNQEKEKLIFKHIIKLRGSKQKMNALFDTLYFNQIVSFLWFYMVKAWFKRNDLPNFGNVSTASLFSKSFYQKCFSILWGIFLNILKGPPQYICVYLRAQIALSLFWMLY